ncbi:MAG: heavy-metal-associated domain-containing protein, partial [Thermoleophilia bacterium]
IHQLKRGHNMSELTFELKGLNCAGCAVKIQENISRMDGVKCAEIIFATQKLNVEIVEKTK